VPRYTEQKIITYLEICDYIPLLLHRPNAGALFIEEDMGGQWVNTRVLRVTGRYKLFVKGKKLRFTPSDNVAYTVPEGT